MKKNTLYFILLLTLPTNLLAQYLGGNGRGDVKDNTNYYGMALNTGNVPISLLSFAAYCNGNNNVINWSTASETNNNYFSIEKSHDCLIFENISNISGAGNSNSLLNYSYTDTEPFSDISYYRLKQTDYDVAYTYSDIIAASCQKKSIEIINIYPNPTSDCFDYVIYSKEDEEIFVYVINFSGKVQISKKENIAKGLNHKSLDVSGLASAPYYLKIETSNGLSKDSKQIFVK